MGVEGRFRGKEMEEGDGMVIGAESVIGKDGFGGKGLGGRGVLGWLRRFGCGCLLGRWKG